MIPARLSDGLRLGLPRRLFSTTSIPQVASQLQNGELTSTQLIETCLSRATQHKGLNAFITVCGERALAQARESDRRRQEGKPLSPLDGIPIAVKDNFCTEGVPTTCASKTLENFVPPYSATVVERLEAAGAVIVGKTNMDEFAMGSGNTTSAYRPSLNPFRRTADTSPCVAGGSSGGSAVAVASGMCLGSIGSDTGGSVRLPASYCGTVGLKPTYGRVSRYGLVAYGSSLDCPGILARDTTSAALILDAIAGHDPRDPTSSRVSTPTSLPPSEDSLKGITIGIPQEYSVAELPKEIMERWQQAAEWLKERGADVVSVSLPHTKAALAAYYVLAPAEASSNLARYDGMEFGRRVEESQRKHCALYADTRGESFGDEVQTRILLGTFCLSRSSYESYYMQAQRVRRLVSNDFKNAFSNHVDVLLTPTALAGAPLLSEWETLSPVQRNANDVFTVPASLAGLPAVSVPAGVAAEGMPLGLQVIGRPFEESTILRIARVLESNALFEVGAKLNPMFK
eukprot:comp6028_c0_seq1/m.1869 comp6028_c0_seq1/g.1869  ORF comp6028_c0_seq1/g.1869 comp6028_c0_seq1/m.1869 type:complete len:514 (-) comp6028_c0_seq1:89-1630(-)